MSAKMEKIMEKRCNNGFQIYRFRGERKIFLSRSTFRLPSPLIIINYIIIILLENKKTFTTNQIYLF